MHTAYVKPSIYSAHPDRDCHSVKEQRTAGAYALLVADAPDCATGGTGDWCSTGQCKYDDGSDKAADIGCGRHGCIELQRVTGDVITTNEADGTSVQSVKITHRFDHKNVSNVYSNEIYATHDFVTNRRGKFNWIVWQDHYTPENIDKIRK